MRRLSYEIHIPRSSRRSAPTQCTPSCIDNPSWILHCSAQNQEVHRYVPSGTYHILWKDEIESQNDDKREIFGSQSERTVSMLSSKKGLHSYGGMKNVSWQHTVFNTKQLSSEKPPRIQQLPRRNQLGISLLESKLLVFFESSFIGVYVAVLHSLMKTTQVITSIGILKYSRSFRMNQSLQNLRKTTDGSWESTCPVSFGSGPWGK